MIVNIGKTIELDINVEAIPANSLEHVIRIGLRNILMDSHAGVSAKAGVAEDQVIPQSRAVAEKKLAALMAGEVRTAGVRAPKTSVDPVQAEAVRLAWEAIKLAFRSKSRDIPKEASVKTDLCAKFLAKYPETMDRAKANVEATAGGDIDLDDLI